MSSTITNEAADPATQVRQGDVLLMPIDRRPGSARPVPRDSGRVVLAYGEVTGHAHAIRSVAARQFEAPEGRFLSVSEPVVLEHEEHGPIAVAPGMYLVIIQREYVPAEINPLGSRQVLD